MVGRNQGLLSTSGPVGLVLALTIALVTACAQHQTGPVSAVGDQASASQDPDDFLVVNCLLPPQLRKLGTRTTFLAPRRAVRTAAIDCEIRGGEYVAYDRATYASALKVWLPEAKNGDAEAQTYVGEIFERGLGGIPDYESALTWYQRAAAQGDSNAQINLGQMYEAGLGVERDPVKALNFYRQASGLGVAFVAAEDTAAEIARLEGEVSDRDRELAALRGDLLSVEDRLASEQSKRRAEQQRLSASQAALEAEQQALAEERAVLAQERDALPAAPTDIEAERLALDERSRDLARLKSSLLSWEQEIAEREQRLAREVEVDKQRLVQEIRRAQQELDQGREALEAERAKLRDDRARLEAERTNQSQATSDQASRSQRLDERERELAQLEETLAAWQADITERERGLVDQNQAQRQADDTAMAAARQELEAERSRLADDRRALDRQKAELEEQRARTIAAGASQEAAAEALASEAARLGELEQALDSREQALATQSQDLEQRAGALDRRVASEEQRLADAKRRIAASEAALERQSNWLSDREATLAAKEREIQNLDEATQARAEAIAEREQELDARAEELKAQRAAFEQRKADVDALDQRIQALNAEAEEKLQALAVFAGGDAPQPRAAPGPRIQMLDPALDEKVRRGRQLVKIRAGTPTRASVGRVESQKPILSFVVNDRKEDLNARQLFRVEIPILRDAETEVDIVAVDADGRRGTLNFALEQEVQRPLQTASLSAFAPVAGRLPQLETPDLEFGRFYALVIGNNNYQHLEQLESAQNDAKAVAELLETRYGFETTLLLDANRYDILSALNAFRAKLTEDDNFLLFYAGHGELDDLNQRGHWLPVDAELDSSANWISNIAITDIINAMSAHRIMIIADSCYSGSLTRSSLARLDSGMSTEARLSWLRTLAQKKARVALSSGGVAPVLDGGGGNHSIFSRALLDVLRQNDGILEGQRLHQEVSARVTYAAEAFRFEQVPQYAPIKYAGHDAGEFFLVPKS
ncbi:MAG: caspase family protein [Geminicoccaceae bacterium]